MKAASEDFVKNSDAYAALVKQTEARWKVPTRLSRKKWKTLVAKMQENYKAIDSFGYETVEGIVAGVPSLADYDIYLDAGVPQSEGPDGVSPVVLILENGEKIDKQGALFTYIIEPALWGGDNVGYRLWTGEREPSRDPKSSSPQLRTRTTRSEAFWRMPKAGTPR